jgi:hypothetical protein
MSGFSVLPFHTRLGVRSNFGEINTKWNGFPEVLSDSRRQRDETILKQQQRRRQQHQQQQQQQNGRRCICYEALE